MYELKLASGKVVTWEGKNGLNACERYADAHPGETVIAWRDIPVGLFIMGDARNIVEPE